jgi:hypothetical protein
MSKFKIENYHIHFDGLFKHNDIFQSYLKFIKEYTKSSSGIALNFAFLRLFYDKTEYSYNDKFFDYIGKLDIIENVKKDTINRLINHNKYCQESELKIAAEDIVSILKNVVDIIKKELMSDSFPLFIRSKNVKKLFET